MTNWTSNRLHAGQNASLAQIALVADVLGCSSVNGGHVITLMLESGEITPDMLRRMPDSTLQLVAVSYVQDNFGLLPLDLQRTLAHHGPSN